MHHELSLQILKSVTTSLGDKLRTFSKNTCSAFVTYELQWEREACIRRTMRQATVDHPRPGNTVVTQTTAIPGSARHPTSIPTPLQHVTAPLSSHRVPAENVPECAPPGGTAGKRLKSFSLQTYKVHALGDYVATIERFGTTDSYSTSTVFDS